MCILFLEANKIDWSAKSPKFWANRNRNWKEWSQQTKVKIQALVCKISLEIDGNWNTFIRTDVCQLHEKKGKHDI